MTGPGAKLEVAGGDILLDNTRGLQIKDSGGTARDIFRLMSDNQTYFNAGGTGSYMSFLIAGTEKVRINTNGNVGIGTTAPGAKLDVAGAIRPQANATSVGEERNQEATVRIYNDPKTCNSANEGAIRYKNNRNTGELCFLLPRHRE